MSLNNKIEKSDLARDALYDKVNVIAEELDEKKQELLIAGENIKTINGESIVGSGNVEISGLNRNITNCITEIPQDIKLELKDGVLTLKAGSKVYVPNGKNADSSNKFDEIITTKDLSLKQKFDNQNMKVFVRSDLSELCTTTGDSSGATTPTASTSYIAFYNTSENKCYFDNGSWIETSLPIAIVDRSADVGFTSIDQVFNGLGYIGSTIFALPGVKGLIPDGRNEDGTLKNIEFEVSNVLTYTPTNVLNSPHWIITDGSYLELWDSISWIGYDEKKNILYNKSTNAQIKYCHIATGLYHNSLLTSNFQPKLPFRAVDYNELNELKQDKATTVIYNNTTNCITEIPQDIKLELKNGELTLKSGSKVWIPYGTSDVYNIGETDSFGNTVVDKSFSDGKFFYAIKTSVDARTTVDAINSYIAVYNPVAKRIDYWGWDGTTSSDGYSDFDGMHYNTSENNIRIVHNDGEIYGNNFSLPICIVSKNTTAVTGFTSIDQVFNGFGYIGSILYALPGVKGLMPNGKNEDGSLKNDVFEIKSVRAISRTSDNKYYMILGNPEGAYNPNSLSTNYLVRENNASDQFGYKYDEYRNMFVGIGRDNIGTQIYMVIVGSFEVYRGLIRFFNSKQVFKAVDSNYNISIKYWD